MTSRDFSPVMFILLVVLCAGPGCDRETLLEPPARFWEPASDVPAGSILSIVTSGDGVVLAAAGHAGILRSPDGGRSWAPANNGLGNLPTWCLAADTTGVLFAGVAGTIHRSRDSGESWNKLDIELTGDNYFTCITAAGSDDIFAFGTYDNAYRSTDGGDTWEEMNITPGLRTYTCAAVDNEGNIFAGYRFHGTVLYGQATLLRSTDNGASWQVSSEGIPRSIVYACAVNDTGTVYVATNYGVFYSTTHGDVWIPTERENLSGSPLSLAVSAGGSILFGTADGVFRSTDNGDSWTVANDGLTDRPTTSLLALPGGDICAGSFFGAMHITGDTELPWRRTNTVGLPSDVRVDAAVSTPDGSIVAAVSHASLRGLTLQSVVRGTDGGADWRHITNGIENYIFTTATDGAGRVFLGTSGVVYRLEPGASVWESSKIAATQRRIEVLAVDDDGRIYAGVSRDGIFRSDDGGDTWHATDGAVENTYITDMAVSPGNVLYASTSHGIFKTSDGGDRWHRIATPENGTAVYRIACDTRGDLFVISNSRLYRSGDGGIHWRHLPVRGTVNVSAIAVDGRDRLWVGTRRNGTFRSSDNGETWTSLAAAEPLNQVTGFIIGGNRRIYAGTWWNGLYRSTAPIE